MQELPPEVGQMPGDERVPQVPVRAAPRERGGARRACAQGIGRVRRALAALRIKAKACRDTVLHRDPGGRGGKPWRHKGGLELRVRPGPAAARKAGAGGRWGPCRTGGHARTQHPTPAPLPLRKAVARWLHAGAGHVAGEGALGF